MRAAAGAGRSTDRDTGALPIGVSPAASALSMAVAVRWGFTCTQRGGYRRRCSGREESCTAAARWRWLREVSSDRPHGEDMRSEGAAVQFSLPSCVAGGGWVAASGTDAVHHERLHAGRLR